MPGNGLPRRPDGLLAMTSSDTVSLRVIARRSQRDRRGNPFPRNDIVRYYFPACHSEEVPKGPTRQSVLIGVTPSDAIPHMSLRGGPHGTDVAIRSHCNDTIRCYSPHVIARRSPRGRRGNPFPRNDIVRYCFPACHCEEVPKGPTRQSVPPQ